MFSITKFRINELCMFWRKTIFWRVKMCIKFRSQNEYSHAACWKCCGISSTINLWHLWEPSTSWSKNPVSDKHLPESRPKIKGFVLANHRLALRELDNRVIIIFDSDIYLIVRNRNSIINLKQAFRNQNKMRKHCRNDVGNHSQ